MKAHRVSKGLRVVVLQGEHKGRTGVVRRRVPRVQGVAWQVLLDGGGVAIVGSKEIAPIQEEGT